MEEKDFKKLLTEQTEEIKRHSKMLLEEFQSQLKVKIWHSNGNARRNDKTYVGKHTTKT